jgi:hypothetical protein
MPSRPPVPRRGRKHKSTITPGAPVMDESHRPARPGEVLAAGGKALTWWISVRCIWRSSRRPIKLPASSMPARMCRTADFAIPPRLASSPEAQFTPTGGDQERARKLMFRVKVRYCGAVVRTLSLWNRVRALFACGSSTTPRVACGAGAPASRVICPEVSHVKSHHGGEHARPIATARRGPEGDGEIRPHGRIPRPDGRVIDLLGSARGKIQVERSRCWGDMATFVSYRRWSAHRLYATRPGKNLYELSVFT